MAKPAPRTLEVIRSEYVTPHMLRVTLGGPEMGDFPKDQESAYIKLLFPRSNGENPLRRTYTVRHQRDGEIDVDFAIHEAAGPASTWAVNTRPGDRILVGGPGPKKLINTDADWFLLAGDMTALPAISVNLSLLPEDAQGHAVIEVVAEDDIQNIEHPANIQIHWLVQPAPDPDGRPLVEHVKMLSWHDGQPAVWAACEFNSMRALRHHFKRECQIPKSHLYISSYWKIGSSEDQHKVAKSKDAELSA